MMSRKTYKVIRDYTGITIGSALMGLGIGVFLVDARVVPGGVSGLGLVRALLPRRSARLALSQRDDHLVQATIELAPPGVIRSDAI